MRKAKRGLFLTMAATCCFLSMPMGRPFWGTDHSSGGASGIR